MRETIVARRERNVFDGLEPNDNLIPRVVSLSAELVESYEEALAKVDDQIAAMVKTRAAWVRLIRDARKALAKQERRA